ncbi:MAG: hypothetical protein AB7V43_19440 [Acidimicrobiia bacterium]
MPWCEDCSKFWNPSTMTADGRCPSCGRAIAVAEERVSADATEAAPPKAITAENIDLRALAGEDAKAPWHFKLLVAAVVLYLVWRVVQLVVWAV